MTARAAGAPTDRQLNTRYGALDGSPWVLNLTTWQSWQEGIPGAYHSIHAAIDILQQIFLYLDALSFLSLTSASVRHLSELPVPMLLRTIMMYADHRKLYCPAKKIQRFGVSWLAPRFGFLLSRFFTRMELDGDGSTSTSSPARDSTRGERACTVLRAVALHQGQVRGWIMTRGRRDVISVQKWEWSQMFNAGQYASGCNSARYGRDSLVKMLK